MERKILINLGQVKLLYTNIVNFFLFVLFFFLLVNKILTTLTKVFQDLTESGIMIHLDTRLLLHSAYRHPTELSFCSHTLQF